MLQCGMCVYVFLGLFGGGAFQLVDVCFCLVWFFVCFFFAGNDYGAMSDLRLTKLSRYGSRGCRFIMSLSGAS